MVCPTRNVILKASGDEITINESDFNDELHEAVDSSPTETKAEESEKADGKEEVQAEKPAKPQQHHQQGRRGK